MTAASDRENQELKLCRALLKGRYPSHVRELLLSRYPISMYEAGLDENSSAYGHGGYVLIPELPAGVTARASRRPDLLEESFLVRALAPAGGWMSARLLQRLADAADEYGEGHVHLSTGGTIEINTTQDKALQLVQSLNEFGLDVGSTGDDLRAVVACCGPARCDAAVVDSTAIATYLGKRFIDEQQYPGFPHKCKPAVAGCPNDCVRAMMQKDHAFVGVYQDLPRVDAERLEVWLDGGGDLEGLLRSCPARAIRRRGRSVTIEDHCLRCMICINRCPGFRPGDERGVRWVIGGKYGSRGPSGPMAGRVIIPFIPVHGDDYAELGDIFERFLDLWSEFGRRKERIGDFILRYGPDRVLEEMGVAAEGGR